MVDPDRRRRAATSATALAVTALGALVADRHPPADRRLFALLNHHRDDPPGTRVLQQAGTPWALPATAVGALLAGRPRLAVAAALALPVEKLLEVGTKKVRSVPRPLFVQPTVLRDDAPVEGGSYPSGHAAIAVAAAWLAGSYAPRPARLVLLGVAGASAIVRVSQGAHHPVDALGGAALGTAVAAGLRAVLGDDA